MQSDNYRKYAHLHILFVVRGLGWRLTLRTVQWAADNWPPCGSRTRLGTTRTYSKWDSATQSRMSDSVSMLKGVHNSCWNLLFTSYFPHLKLTLVPDVWLFLTHFSCTLYAQPSPLLSWLSLSFSNSLPFQISVYKVLSVVSSSSLHFNSSGETLAFFDNHSYSNDSIIITSLTLISSETSCPTHWIAYSPASWYDFI